MSANNGYSMRTIFNRIALLLALCTGAAQAEYPQLPEFSLPTQSGQVTQASYENRVVYVDFWASWCKPCKQSFPFLNDLQQRYRKNGLVVLAINLDKDPEQARQFLQHIPAHFTVAFDQQGVTAQSFHVQGMPSSYLIDRKGNIRARHIGFREEDKDKLEQAVASLLKE